MPRSHSPRRAGPVIVLFATLIACCPVFGQSAPAKPAASDRTTAVLQAMTGVQRIHSGLFDRFATGDRILDTSHSVDTIVDRVGSRTPTSFVDLLRRLVCSSDAVVEGRITTLASNPIKDGTFLFTDYTLSVVERFRGPAALQAAAGQSVVLTRAGGELSVDGVTIRATSSDFPLLKRDESYIVMGKFISATGAIQSSEIDTTYWIAGNRAKRIGPGTFVTGPDLSVEGRDSGEFRTAVRDAASRCSGTATPASPPHQPGL